MFARCLQDVYDCFELSVMFPDDVTPQTAPSVCNVSGRARRIIAAAVHRPAGLDRTEAGRLEGSRLARHPRSRVLQFRSSCSQNGEKGGKESRGERQIPNRYQNKAGRGKLCWLFRLLYVGGEKVYKRSLIIVCMGVAVTRHWGRAELAKDASTWILPDPWTFRIACEFEMLRL